jgi:hypothetical protein
VENKTTLYFHRGMAQVLRPNITPLPIAEDQIVPDTDDLFFEPPPEQVQNVVNVLDKYLPTRDMPQTPLHLKKTRRESASVIDDFFCFGDPLKIKAPSAPQSGSAKTATAAATAAAAAKMLTQAEKQALFSDDENARRQSSSIIEEFFGIGPDDKATEKWIKQEPTVALDALDTDPMEVFDIDSTMYESVMAQTNVANLAPFVAADSSAAPNVRAPNGVITSDAMWEDLTASMDMVNNHMPCDTATSTCNSNMMNRQNGIPTIKSEPMDCEMKPSCQFGRSAMAPAIPTTTVENFLFDTSNHYRISSGDLERNAVSLAGVPTFSNIPGTSVKTTFSPSPCSSNSQVVIQHSTSSSCSGGVVNIGGGHHVPSTSGFMCPSTSQHLNKSHNSMAGFSTASPAPHVVPNLFLPPTPPNSQPGSPSTDAIRRTPPPPYPGNTHIPRPVISPAPSSIPVTISMITPSSRSDRPRKQPVTHPGCSTIKYNRKNNPELEKRRIHFCSFPGKS